MTLTNSLNLTTILAVSTIFFGAAAIIIPKIFSLYRQILKEIYDLKAWQAQYLQSLTQNQTAQLEECIHKLPGHPENPNPVPVPVVVKTKNLISRILNK